MKRFVIKYLYLSGLLAHICLIMLLVWQPLLIVKLSSLISGKYYQIQKDYEYKKLTGGKNTSVKQEINLAIKPWQPQKKIIDSFGKFYVNKQSFFSLSEAVKNLNHGDTLFIDEGVYSKSIVIKKNNVTIKGNGHVVFETAAAHDKGYILSQGNNLTVENIECRNISVRDGNGACVRLEGKDLTLDHVYFHSSQEGVLETSKKRGIIRIINSRFEKLGFNGQAHGIYTTKADVYIEKTLFLAAKNQGHAIKVRGSKLNINQSILASFSSDDSRLIDMPNGGELTITNSMLEQGPNSVNGQMIGLGLEGVIHTKNQVTLIDNLILLDRLGKNVLLVTNKGESKVTVSQKRNVIIGQDSSFYKDENNFYFNTRAKIGLPKYPYFPISICNRWENCPVLDTGSTGL